ncbi:MAG: hypothetical protein NT145_06030 [Elusimicrobia bacterium]|nr:hypothetical protein [Elusimicrobiota bacterium]
MFIVAILPDRTWGSIKKEVIKETNIKINEKIFLKSFDIFPIIGSNTEPNTGTKMQNITKVDIFIFLPYDLNLISNRQALLYCDAPQVAISYYWDKNLHYF